MSARKLRALSPKSILLWICLKNRVKVATSNKAATFAIFPKLRLGPRLATPGRSQHVRSAVASFLKHTMNSKGSNRLGSARREPKLGSRYEQFNSRLSRNRIVVQTTRHFRP